MGGANTEVFLFSVRNTGRNTDRIADYNLAQDQIWLLQSVFGALGRGRLDQDNFHLIGSGVRDADDYILYNRSSGVISCDADGLGSSAAWGFAVVSAGLAMEASDFLVL